MIAESFEHIHEPINGLEYHVVTAGPADGPAVLFCHGFPDLWMGWRHQMTALAAQGYRVIAPDLRGFGETQAPVEPTAYTSVDLVGDLVSILEHFHIAQAVIVGHDWGATIAWAAALIRPDRFVAVACLSVPYTPHPPASLPEMLRQVAPPDLYMLYFLEPGPADAELDDRPDEFLRRLYYTNSGALPEGAVPSMRLSPNGSLIDALDSPPTEMPWFDESSIATYADHFSRTGFTPALNTYRSLHRSWELMAAWADRSIEVPAMYIGGERDVVRFFPGNQELINEFVLMVPHARPPVIIDGVGHFIHMERPDLVNALLLDFLADAKPLEHSAIE